MVGILTVSASYDVIKSRDYISPALENIPSFANCPSERKQLVS